MSAVVTTTLESFVSGVSTGFGATLQPKSRVVASSIWKVRMNILGLFYSTDISIETSVIHAMFQNR